MKTITLQQIIEEVIEENPTKNVDSNKLKQLERKFEQELEDYFEAKKEYRKAIKLNPNIQISEPEKPKAPTINSNKNKKRIEDMRDKFRKILMALKVDPALFKIQRQYIFPLKSKSYIKEILQFDLNKTPLYSLNKGGDKEEHFNENQLKNIQKLRKVIHKIIGYQLKNTDGLIVAMKITKELKINEKKAEEYIQELLNTPIPVSKRISALFDEGKYPGLTIEERADIFEQIRSDFEMYIEEIENNINKAAEQYLQRKSKTKKLTKGYSSKVKK